ncbi:MAG: hypothetical protein ACK5O7_06535 [Holosporales bacterium]
MMKFIPVVALSAVALSAAAHAEPGRYTGFHAGVFGGYSMGHTKANMKFNRNQSDATQLDILNEKSNTNLSGTGGIGGLELGYTKDFGKAALGVVAHGLFGGPKGKAKSSIVHTDNLVGTPYDQDLTSTRVRAKRKNAFGLTVRPGVTLGDGLLSLVMGWERAKWEVRRLDSTTFVLAGVPGRAVNNPYKVLPAKGNKSLNGWILGAAATMPLSQRVFIEAEYRHVWYSKIKSHKGKSANADMRNYHVSFKPHVGDALVKLKYKW